MRGLTNLERGYVAMALRLRGMTVEEAHNHIAPGRATPEQSAAFHQLLRDDRIWVEQGVAHKVPRLTPSGDLAYRLDSLARGLT